MADSTYSTVDDLLIGDMPVAMSFSKQKFVNDAANEVDSIIGVRYVTPVDVSPPPPDGTGPLPRHASLFVKRAANHLASGRLILALAAGGEDQALHAYGWSLVKGALDALNQIASGQYDLPGADPLPTDQDTRVTGPQLGNVDASSGVEAFYGYVAPRLPYYPPLVQCGPYWAPGGGS